TLSMEYVDRLEIISLTKSGRLYPSSNQMRFNVRKDRSNKRGQYFTFFHELGHAIDYNYGVDHGKNGHFSSAYKTGGKTLAGHMHADVRRTLQTELLQELQEDAYKDWNGLEVNSAVHNIIESFVYNGPKDIHLTEEQQALSDTVKNKLSNELYNDIDHNVSDIYGGVTINEVVGKWSHSDKDYWIDLDTGQRITEPSGEGFASYFGTMMLKKDTLRKDQIESLETYVPSSHTHMEKMIEEMGKSENP